MGAIQKETLNAGTASIGQNGNAASDLIKTAVFSTVGKTLMSKEGAPEILGGGNPLPQRIELETAAQNLLFSDIVSPYVDVMLAKRKPQQPKT